MINGVIFDLDGTLGDTLPVCFAAFRDVFVEFTNTEYTDAEIKAMFGPTEEGILMQHIPSAALEAIERYHERYVVHHDLVPDPFPGLDTVLDRLERHGVPTAIVTGKGMRSAEESLQCWGLRHRFDPVEAGSDNGPVKSAKMQRVLDTWGLEPSEVISVGDVITDITAAHAVGIAAVAVSWASTTDAAELLAAAPDYHFDDIATFDTWLAEHHPDAGSRSPVL